MSFKNVFKKIIFTFIILLMVISCSNLNLQSNRDSIHSNQIFNDFSVIDSLNQQIIYKDLYIDSLNTIIDYLNFSIDSLKQEIEITYSKVLINDSFEIPYKYSFAGVEFDLTNDRIRNKLNDIYNIEVRKAHQFIPRSGIYFPLMDSIFAKYDIHPDVKYLAVAESNLNYMAYSPAAAAGIWQFIPSTAKMYNLKIDSYVDERRNIFKSTDAACRYLIRAYQQLNGMGIDDWLITLAAYNSGIGNISRTIREQNGKDFFSLIMRVEETNNYVWRAIATKLIFENEEKIFEKPFDRLPELMETANIVQLNLNGFYDLAEWAIAHGTTAGRLWELNPWIKLSRTSTGRYSKINHLILPPGNYEILVPSDSEQDDKKVSEIEKKFLVKNNSPFITGPSHKHKVSKGETLIGLARKYNVKVDDIKRWNNLKSNTIYIGQTLHFQGNEEKYGQYKVQSGDTLAEISKKLGVSTSHLISKNKLQTVKRDGMDIVIIRPGQLLEY